MQPNYTTIYVSDDSIIQPPRSRTGGVAQSSGSREKQRVKKSTAAAVTTDSDTGTARGKGRARKRTVAELLAAADNSVRTQKRPASDVRMSASTSDTTAGPSTVWTHGYYIVDLDNLKFIFV